MNQEKIQQLQLMEQSINQFLMQKQQFQLQLSEIDSALEEIKDTKEAYKIVGNIMVLSKKEDIEKDLKKKKEIVELRIKTIEKQESQIKEKSKKLQEEAMKELEKEKK
jgi:prefoldin beta subunit